MTRAPLDPARAVCAALLAVMLLTPPLTYAVRLLHIEAAARTPLALMVVRMIGRYHRFKYTSIAPALVSVGLAVVMSLVPVRVHARAAVWTRRLAVPLSVASWSIFLVWPTTSATSNLGQALLADLVLTCLVALLAGAYGRISLVALLTGPMGAVALTRAPLAPFSSGASSLRALVLFALLLPSMYTHEAAVHFVTPMFTDRNPVEVFALLHVWGAAVVSVILFSPRLVATHSTWLAVTRLVLFAADAPTNVASAWSAVL